MTHARSLAGAALAMLGLAALAQMALFNIRLNLLLRIEAAASELSGVEMEIEQLESERAFLLNPARLEAAGAAMGLGPLPLEMIAVAAPQGGREEVQLAGGSTAGIR